MKRPSLRWSFGIVFAAVYGNAHGQWVYAQTVDKLTDAVDKSAYVLSTNVERFDFPYQGGSKARIFIRSRAKGRTTIQLNISRGQFVCSEPCDLNIRIGDDEPEIWRAAPPDDGSSDTLFFWKEEELFERLQSAKRVRIQATFYQEGQRVFEFKTANFLWPASKLKSIP